MKKIFFAGTAIAACMLISCNDKSAGKTDNTAADSAKMHNAAILKAIETGDVSNIKDYMAEDAIDHNGSPTGQDIKGRDSIIAMLGSVNKCFQPGLKIDIISQAVDGDYLFCLSEMKGKTSADNPMGMPPNMDVNMKGVDVSKLKDGKFTDHWSFMTMADMQKMMAAMGPMDGKDKMPPPAAGGDKKMPADTMKK